MHRRARFSKGIRAWQWIAGGAALGFVLAVAPLPVLAGATPASPSVPVEPGHQLNVSSTISELPVPPTVPANGVCTNPTGCVSGQWGALDSPGFYWDSHYVLLGVIYAGAPTTGPSSIYTGRQVVLERTDGTTFPDGDAWKCITCGITIPSGIEQSYFTYPPPRALPGDKQILVGNGILECVGSTGLLALSNPACTPASTRIYPIYWGASPLGGPGGLLGNGREWRLSPDGVHLEWDSFALVATGFTENEFEGTLSWDQADQRYNLIDVYLLPQATGGWVEAPGNQLVFQPRTMIGEARGWSSDGRSILGFESYEDNSIDAFATNLTTGNSRPLTVHAEYTDPMQMSPNGKWMINDSVAGSGRMDFLSGLEGISPITMLMTLGDEAQMRNAKNRRFFEPWLTSTSAPLTEQINAAVANPDWNALADPTWLANSAAVVWAEGYACGANAPTLECAGSGEPGGRNSRVMIARLGVSPTRPVPPPPISNTAPAAWAIPYTSTTATPTPNLIPTGTYTIKGNVFGYATAQITDNSAGTALQSIQVLYHNYVQKQGLNLVNGTEEVDTITVPGDITWNDNLTIFGLQGFGTQVTSPGGFSVNIADLGSNNFQAIGSMTTTLNGVTYTQPTNGN